MAHVSLKRLEKVYPNGFKAVHGIDLDIRDGEFIVFVGPSGCAKSTVLRMIAGLESISGGELHIGGAVVNNLPPKQRGIAMVFQNYALYPHMKVRDNLGFGLKLAGVGKQELTQRVEQAARTLEIEHLLDRYPKQLSGGQAQRVAVGRAIVKRPEVFLFDEPLSNLDAKLRASMRVRITELHRRLKERGQPSTVVYVTHDQVEAMTMGERICVLKDGTIQQVDTPTALYDRPANAFVAGFIGSPEMNIRDARVVQQGAGLGVEVGGICLALPEHKAARLRARVGTPVRLGIRPEHIASRHAAGGEGQVVTGRLRFQEHMGSEVFVHFDLGDVPFACRISADRLGALGGLARGEPHEFAFLMDQCHVFDADSGANLTL
ncbi:ABC transporter ATP-binding protein [Eleftheria terrae]|uniref:ABC transporter ATP-binding protein n=1 Tax=Eleftheria terrae TaxID=1597781 RepID=UPI00263B9187|nr:sn-glycerol-3-phosphate ABC transporter ATP-binding protein UgpC [Eleftheria terrae]WKB53807.1 sn-glycerol-3-phosphate ABC transporter ATP-binding protein UgpC [Eleftheria terrae]